jgi:hypothetical protein
MVHVVQIQNAVGIAHRDARDLVLSPVHLQRVVENLAVGVNRDFSSLEDRLPHIDLDLISDQARTDDPGQSLHFQFFLLGQTVLVDVLSEAADAVSAHLHLAAIGIVNLHLEVADLRGMDCEELVGADAEAAVAESLGQLFQIGDLILQTIDQDEVVAAAMHLGEVNLALLIPFGL